MSAFVNSGLARQFELQSSVYVSGMSGSELVEWALAHSGRADLADAVPFDAKVGLSIPYWIGEMVAYFQMKCGRTYKWIFARIPYARLRELYFAYGECVPDELIEVFQRVAEERPFRPIPT